MMTPWWYLPAALALFLTLIPALAEAGCSPLPDRSCSAQVNFREKRVVCNELVSRESTRDPPTISLADSSSEASEVLVVMVDPDAPTSETCPPKYFLHWVAYATVSSRRTLAIRNTVLDYSAPEPPVSSPAHRYQVLVFPRETSLDIGTDDVSRRQGFDLNAFISANNLGDPIATFQFKVQH